MGLSASQARLLSITARLSDNELHSQQLANAKVRLADQTQQASADYIKALDSSKLVYTSYDANGEKQCVDLTPGLMYTYSPIKNQYAMMTADNKILVSAKDATNFENTKDLYSFLTKYDLTYDVSDSIYEAKMAEWQEMRDAKYDAWKKEFDEWDKKHEQYLKDLEAWNKEKELGNLNLYQKFTNIVGDSHATHSGDEGFCYRTALNSLGGTGCYIHLMNHLLGYVLNDGATASPYGHLKSFNYTTSTGINFSSSATDLGAMGDDIYRSKVRSETMAELSEAIRDRNILCDGHDVFFPYYDTENGADGVNDYYDDSTNYILYALSKGRSPQPWEILASDYIYEDGRCAGIKTLKQKAADLYYLVNNYSSLLKTDADGNRFTSDTQFKLLRSLLINFTEGDLKQVSKEPEFNEEEPVWNEPPQPEKETYICLKDADQAQWYINLWHAMNGSDTANMTTEIDYNNPDGYWSYVPEDIQVEYKYLVANSYQSSTNNYKILEDNLMSSSSWLKFALESGIITLAKAEYYNPSADSKKASEIRSAGITWQSIAFSSAADIHEVDDERAIAKAEAEYTKKLNEIEAKDKKYDNDIKKLDTEHNALKTEYESVQNVITKNVDRSFKAFS